MLLKLYLKKILSITLKIIEIMSDVKRITRYNNLKPKINNYSQTTTATGQCARKYKKVYVFYKM